MFVDLSLIDCVVFGLRPVLNSVVSSLFWLAMSSSGEKRGPDEVGARAPDRNVRSRVEPLLDGPPGSIGASSGTSSVTPAVPPVGTGATLGLGSSVGMAGGLGPGVLTTPAPDSLRQSALGAGSGAPVTSTVGDPRRSRSAKELVYPDVAG